MQQFYFTIDRVATVKDLVKGSEKDTKEMFATLVEILQRKELLSDKDLANILGIDESELKRSPF